MNESTAADRRTFLKMVAGGALGAGTSGIVANSVAQESPTGKLVFTYDDGVVEDYEQAYQQAHQPEGVPACTAMISSRVNTSNSLSESQLHELQNAGWEIMSHSMIHRALADIPVTQEVEPGADKIYVSWNKHGKNPGDTIRLLDSNKSEVVTVAGNGSDSSGAYVTLRDEVTQQFSPADTIERYTDDIVRTELKDSQERLREYGLSANNAVMPYGAYGERTQEIASEYYTAVANAAVDNGDEVNGDKGLNPYDDLNLPHLSRRYFREGKMTYDEIGAFLDRVASEDVLGIFGGHTWWDRHGDDPLPPERIRNTIQMAKDRNIEIVTLQQALDDLGYTGGSTTTTTQEPTTTETTTATTTETTTTATTTATTTETTEDPTTTETTTSTSTTTESTPTTTTETTTDTTTTETTTETTETTTETTTDTTETTETTETTTDGTTQTTTTDTTTESPTEDESNTPPDAPETETTTQNNSGNGGGGGGGGGGGSAPTTTEETTTTTQTPTTTETQTTTTTTESPTTMPLVDETPTSMKTPTSTKTPTSAESSLTDTTRNGGNPGVDVPGFGWLATFGAAGSLAAYALSQLDGDDEE